MITDPNVQAILTASSGITTLNNGIAQAAPIIDAQLSAQSAQILADKSAIAGLNAQLSSLAARRSFFDLQQAPLFTLDKKIPFQWIQPGNSGNDGGLAPLPHGTCSMTLQSDGSCIAKVNPVKLPGGKSDNFLFYDVLPFPHSAPNKFGFDCSRFNAASEADWANSQQMEWWDELIDGGYQYTMNWAVNPVQGLQYFDRSLNKWIPYMPLGKPILIDMGKPTNWSFTASIDRKAHTVLYETLTCGPTQYDVEKTCNAVVKAGSQFSTSFQMDGKALAPAYSAVLDGWNVWYE